LELLRLLPPSIATAAVLFAGLVLLWCCFGAAAKLNLLMELMRREESTAAAEPAAAAAAGRSSSSHCSNQQQHQETAGKAAAAACCTQDRPDHHQQQQQQQQKQDLTVTAEQADHTPAPCASPKCSCSSSANISSQGAAFVSAAERELSAVVDHFVTCNALEQVLRHASSYRAASFINLATGEQLSDAVSSSHWQQVAATMAVTQQQRQQLAVVLQQFVRQRQQLAAQQHALCGSLADDTARKLELLSLRRSGSAGGGSGSSSSNDQTSKASTSSSSGGSSKSSEPSAAAAAAPAEGIVSQMLGNLWGLTTTTQMLAQCMLNTLSRLQLARMIVASYPFLPQAGASELLLPLLLLVMLLMRLWHHHVLFVG
jgi:chemotaxis protein histidine kinase CheA